MRVADETLFTRFTQQRPQYASDAACHRALSVEYALAVSYIRRRLNQYRALVVRDAARCVPTPQLTIIHAHPIAPVEVLPAVIDDTPEIKSRIALLTMTLDRMARVLIVSDEHLDDADPRALQLNVAIARWFQPDILVFNGDTHDLSALSRFDKDRRGGKRDAFKQVRAPWLSYARAMIDATTYSNSNCLRIFQWGNHNERQEAMSNAFWEAGDTLEEAYAALCRVDGKILLTGGRQQLYIGPFLVQHGQRHGVNAGKLALESDLGGAQPVVQGHTHGVSLFAKRTKLPGQDRWIVVSSLVAGFAGNNPPAYESRRKDSVKWIQSCAYAHVNLRSDDVHTYPILYHERPDGSLVAAAGHQVFSAQAAQAAALPMAA